MVWPKLSHVDIGLLTFVCTKNHALKDHRILFAKGSGILASLAVLNSLSQSHSPILYGDEIHAASQSNHMPKQNSSQATPTTTLAREQVPHAACWVVKSKKKVPHVCTLECGDFLGQSIGMIWKPFCCTVELKIPQPAQASIKMGVSLQPEGLNVVAFELTALFGSLHLIWICLRQGGSVSTRLRNSLSCLQVWLRSLLLMDHLITCSCSHQLCWAAKLKLWPTFTATSGAGGACHWLRSCFNRKSVWPFVRAFHRRVRLLAASHAAQMKPSIPLLIANMWLEL